MLGHKVYLLTFSTLLPIPKFPIHAAILLLELTEELEGSKQIHPDGPVPCHWPKCELQQAQVWHTTAYIVPVKVSVHISLCLSKFRSVYTLSPVLLRVSLRNIPLPHASIPHAPNSEMRQWSCLRGALYSHCQDLLSPTGLWVATEGILKTNSPPCFQVWMRRARAGAGAGEFHNFIVVRGLTDYRVQPYLLIRLLVGRMLAKQHHFEYHAWCYDLHYEFLTWPSWHKSHIDS